MLNADSLLPTQLKSLAMIDLVSVVSVCTISDQTQHSTGSSGRDNCSTSDQLVRLVDPDPKPRGASLSDAVQLADWSASPIVSVLTLRGESLVEAERGMEEHLHLVGEWRDEWWR